MEEMIDRVKSMYRTASSYSYHSAPTLRLNMEPFANAVIPDRSIRAFIFAVISAKINWRT